MKLPTDATRATAGALPEKPTGLIIGQAQDLIHQSDSLVELLNMAAESSQIVGDAGNAVAWCCIHIRSLLKKADGMLTEARKGGAA